MTEVVDLTRQSAEIQEVLVGMVGRGEIPPKDFISLIHGVADHFRERIGNIMIENKKS
jgi:hypothetical protein